MNKGEVSVIVSRAYIILSKKSIKDTAKLRRF